MKTGLLALGRQRLERLVVLVDVQVFAQGNVNYSLAYASLIHSCVERALSSCNELNTRHKSGTTWGYKLFDSSLSPIASTSNILKLLKEAALKHIAGFKSAEENLGRFQQTLTTAASELGSSRSTSSSPSRADFVVRALQEVLSDFTWNSVFISDGSSSDEDQTRQRSNSLFGIQQNLVMVFSHMPEFSSEILETFSTKMKRLHDPFQAQGIRGCWIDMPSVSTSVEAHNLQNVEIHSAFSKANWKFTTVDSLAIASECLPSAMLWSSVAYPDLQVQSNALKMQAKLRIMVQDREGKQFQPDICRLQVLPLVSASSLKKESVSAMLKMSKAERSPPVVKIVVKSLIQKQDISFKCSLQYLLHHRADCATDVTTRSNMASAGKRVQKTDPGADEDVVAGHDILKQLQEEPSRRFEPGERSWQVLLIAIARKRSVAEVDLYIDGICSSALLEPITVQCAALLQKDDCSKQLPGSKPLLLLRSGEDLVKQLPRSMPLLLLQSGEDSVKQDMRSRKRTGSVIPEDDGPAVKREKLVGGFKQKPSGVEEINCNKREGYSWVQHWRHILRRKTIGTGKVRIENRYMRPRQGQKPSKPIQIIKCWLDQVSKCESLAEQQLVPFSPATPGYAEPVTGDQVLDAGLNQVRDSEMVRLDGTSIVPLMGKDPFSAFLNTKENAESYLSSIEQMVHDCLQSDSGDLQLFVKGILANATQAQQILLNKNQASDSVRPFTESSAQKNSETVQPCTSDSSCASNVSKKGKSGEGQRGFFQELLCSVSGVGNGAIDYGGSSDGADSAGQMVLHDGNHQEATDESQPNCDDSIISEKVAEQLMDKLLLKPKKLAKQYKDGDSAAPDIAHIRKEKLRAYELQILFRMELIERDCGGPLEKEKTKIVKEICRLLDDIQFDLGGGVFGNESLHDYSIRVVQNRYNELLPQTVADIFERMEFNGYVEGMSEVQAAPDSAPAPADLVGPHDRKATERGEFIDNVATTDAASKPSSAAAHAVDENVQSGAIPTLIKGRTKSRRKRSVPIDAFTRASEKRKLAGRLAHFGGPESLHRLRKVKIHHQSPKPPKVSSAARSKYQSKEHNVVLETPRFERQNVRAETPIEEDEVESNCTQVRTSAFGFGTPARVSKHVQPTTRKRRLALFSQKKPPGRGLPRISRDVMKALAEGETAHPRTKLDCQVDLGIVDHNECAGESAPLPHSSQEQRLPDPGWRSQPLKDSTNLTGWVLRESCHHDIPDENESSRRTEPNKLASNGQANPFILDAALETQVLQESSCDPQASAQQQAAHDFDSSTLMNSIVPTSIRKNRRKSLYTSKSRKPDSSKPQYSTQIVSLPAAERDLFGARSAAQEPVDLTSSDNRWNDDVILCSPPEEVPMNYGNAQHTIVETQSIADSERNGSSANLAKRHGFLSSPPSQELASRSTYPKANFSELGAGETELLFETQIVEEVHSLKHRFRSPKRALYEDTLCLSPPDAPLTWDMPCLDLNGTQDLERVASSPIADRLVSPGNCNLYSTSPFRSNQTPNRVDPPTVRAPGLIADDPPVDLEFTQIMNEIFYATDLMEKAGAEGCRGQDAGDCIDEYSLLLDENWSPVPRLKPEARLSARSTPTELQRKKLGVLDEDTVAAITGGSPVKFSSPTLNKKFRRPSEGSPRQSCPNTPNGPASCKKRPRSTTASPKETPKEKRNKMLRFT